MHASAAVVLRFRACLMCTGVAEGTQQGAAAVSGVSSAAPAAAAAAADSPGLPPGSAAGSPRCAAEGSVSVGATSSGASPVSARSGALDSDSMLSKDSCATRNAVDQGPESTESNGEGTRQHGAAVTQLRLRKTGPGPRQSPPPAPSDVSSTGQASVIDIMDQRFMGVM